MEIDKNFETCLFLSSSKIAIGVYEQQSLKKLFYDEILNNHNFTQSSHELLNHFLEKNIFDIEKSSKNFVENIYLIVESDKFLTINISIKKNNYGDKITRDKFIHLLNEAKISCKKTIGDSRITHMVIDNYFVDGKNYSLFPNDLKCDSFSLDLRFICLRNDYIQNLENVLKKYQISIKHILNADYVKSIKNEDQDDLFKMSLKIIDGYNENEVLIIPKLIKNKGFFERFFNFFS
jgi:cell division protein FtsA